MSAYPVHESRDRGVYYEVPGDGGSAIVWCNNSNTSLHYSPTGWYCHSEEEALASAERHAQEHANVPDPVSFEDNMIVRPMPPQAYLSERDAQTYRTINRKTRGAQYGVHTRDEAEALFAQGLGYRKVASRLGISQWTVKTWAEQWQAVA